MNRKKWALTIIAVVCLIVITTLIMKDPNKEVMKHDFTVVGESDHWSAEYHMKGERTFYYEDDRLKGDSNDNSQLKVTYKGDISELSGVRRLTIDSCGGSSSWGYNEPPTEKVFVRSGGCGSTITEEDVIEVTVKWGEEAETIELMNNE